MRFLFGRNKSTMVAPAEALAGRDLPAFAVPERHAVSARRSDRRSQKD
jgi:hypothetical protein